MLPSTKKRRAFQIFRAAAARNDLNIAGLVSKREADKSTSHKRSRDQRASKMQCEDIPIDSSLVEAADEFLKAVVDATEGTGEAEVFPVRHSSMEKDVSRSSTKRQCVCNWECCESVREKVEREDALAHHVWIGPMFGVSSAKGIEVKALRQAIIHHLKVPKERWKLNRFNVARHHFSSDTTKHTFDFSSSQAD
jgi:hypothetical protein